MSLIPEYVEPVMVASTGVFSLRRCPGREEQVKVTGMGFALGGHSHNSISSSGKSS